MSETIERAYSLLTYKSFEEVGRRRIRGIATTPTPDRLGDVFETAGAVWADAIPLLLHHKRETPVGTTRLSRKGDVIEFEAELPTIQTPGPVRDEVERAWTSVTSEPPLIRGASIGFRLRGPLSKAIEETSNGLRFLQTEIVELSLVTVPANQQASLEAVRALDAEYLAASGRSPSPGAAGIRRMESTLMETTTDQIRSWEATRAAKVARMDAILAKANEQHVTLDATETEEHDALALEVKGIDGHLQRLAAQKTRELAQATPVPSNANGRPADVQRSIVVVNKEIGKGIPFVRAICAQIVCKGNRLEAAEYAARRWNDTTPEVALYLKAAVAPGSTTDATWAKPLVPERITDDFLALLRPATILGKLQGLREVPFNTKVATQTAGGTYNWVGETKPKPVTKLAFSSTTLPATKVAGIIVISKELAMLSDPKAEDVVRADMIAGIAAFLDSQFIDPAVAAVVGVKPASITNGVTPITSVGPLQDIVAIASAMSAANLPLGGLAYIMSETNALVMSFRVDAQGNRVFPSVSAGGGTVNGLQVITSNAAGTNVIGLIPSQILYADSGGVEIDVSQEASLQMSDSPMDPADATTVYMSLWQNNLIGLRAEKFANWLKANAAAVKYVNNATYTIPAGTMVEAAGAPVPNGRKRE